MALAYKPSEKYNNFVSIVSAAFTQSLKAGQPVQVDAMEWPSHGGLFPVTQTQRMIIDASAAVKRSGNEAKAESAVIVAAKEFNILASLRTDQGGYVTEIPAITGERAPAHLANGLTGARLTHWWKVNEALKVA